MQLPAGSLSYRGGKPYHSYRETPNGKQRMRSIKQYPGAKQVIQRILAQDIKY